MTFTLGQIFAIWLCGFVAGFIIAVVSVDRLR